MEIGYDKQGQIELPIQRGDLVYIISPLTSQLRTASRKVAVKYIGLVVVYEIIDPHNYLLMMLDGKILRGIFEH